MAIISYASVGTKLYVRLDNTASSLFPMVPGTGKKARRYAVADTVLEKAKLPPGRYTGEVCKGTVAAAGMDDASAGVVSFLWDGKRETTWAELFIQALLTPNAMDAIKVLAETYGVPH